MAVNRFEVHLINLDPTIGSEIKKTRPCLIISPDEMNHHIRTVIVRHDDQRARLPIPCNMPLQGQKGASGPRPNPHGGPRRLVRKLGRLDSKTSACVLAILQEMFAP